MDIVSVSIIGCGWLGLPLAKKLISHGYLVKGSTTTFEKIPELKKAGIFSFCLNVGHEVTGEGRDEFFESDIVVITLPFKRNFTDPAEYHKQIAAIKNECVKSPRVRHVIFTGSTSVYPSDLKFASEETEFIADDDRAKVLKNIEKELLNQSKFKTTVIRLAGLYGPGRQIGKFMAGKKDLAGGDQPVNLIHLDDAVGILYETIRQNAGGQIFNACSGGHPLRKELYTEAAKNLGLPEPVFREGAIPGKKIVDNRKVKDVLNYRFLHPDPLDDIREKGGV